jgi:hypothetical protein
MMYEVIEKFYLFEFNPKTHGMRAMTYELGEQVTETVRKRLKDPQRYVMSVNK